MRPGEAVPNGGREPGGAGAPPGRKDAGDP